MNRFSHQGFTLNYFDSLTGKDPVLLIHGFASNIEANWVFPNWIHTLTQAQHRVIAIDNRGHGKSDKSYNSEEYTPLAMAGDAVALLDHLGIEKTHIMGYSMGARVSAHLALHFKERVNRLVLGGLATGIFELLAGTNEIVAGLLTDNPASISDERAKAFRIFADQTKSDRRALAACLSGSRSVLTRQEVGNIAAPTLVAVGEHDDIAGSADELAELIPGAVALTMPGRDHMKAVGDRLFKENVVAFLNR